MNIKLKQVVPIEAAARHQLSMAELFGALSYALDMTEGQPPGHCIRACWIGMQIGMAHGVSGRELWELYYTILLKDLGCSSNAARISALYATDDLRFKHNFKTVDRNLLRMMSFILKNTGLQENMTTRFRKFLQTFRYGGDWAKELMETRCERGASIARQLRFNNAVAEGIRALDEHWDGGGKPYGLKSIQIPLNARIALLSQVIDVCHSASGSKACMSEIQRRSGIWFDPVLVDCFRQIADADFWQQLRSPDLADHVTSMEPSQYVVPLDDAYIDDIAAAFGQIIDSKSPYTAGHSRRVETIVDTMAQAMDYPHSRRKWLKRGALLHDVGKLGVSNSILDKPGSLSDDEFMLMKNHTLYTGRILSRIKAFSMLAEVAQSHHERLDGRGYPLGLRSVQISLDTRLIAIADIYDAITAERPYRGPTPADRTLDIMRGMVDNHIDRECFEVLCDIVHTLPEPEPLPPSS